MKREGGGGGQRVVSSFRVIFVFRDLIFITWAETQQSVRNLHLSKHRPSLMEPYLLILEFMIVFNAPPLVVT